MTTNRRVLLNKIKKTTGHRRRPHWIPIRLSRGPDDDRPAVGGVTGGGTRLRMLLLAVAAGRVIRAARVTRE